MSTWQPIETAPKEPVEILVWDGHEHKIAWWGGSNGWIFGDDWIRCHPTHWQPLPAPPKSSTSTNGNHR
jgi:hypothetical protein